MNELMKGIEILSVENISYLSHTGMFLFVLGWSFILCGIILGIYFLCISEQPTLLFIIPIGILLLIFSSNCKKIEYTQYKVLIDENVPLLEFNQKYEITDIDGKIYTIKEIETE